MRLIDADALEQKLGMLGVSNAFDRPSFWYGKDKKDYKVIPTKYHNGYDNALADVEKAIQELPTIDTDNDDDIYENDVCVFCGKLKNFEEYGLVEQKVGKWITKSKRNPLCLAGKFFWRECSVCGWCREDDSTANDTPFCPMCGAKMEEGD